MSTEKPKYLSIVNSLCIQNKYCRWYNQLIETAIRRSSHYESIKNKKKEYKKLHGYGEAHHILPQSIGNDKDSKNRENITILSYREHYIAHLLLSKMFIHESCKRKMLFALNMILTPTRMERKIQINSRIYNAHKKAFRQLMVEHLNSRQAETGLTKGLTKYIHEDTHEIRCFPIDSPPSNQWQTFNTGKVVAINLETSEKILLTKEEFENSSKYRGHTYDKIFAYDPITLEKVIVSKEEYSRGKYIHPNHGRRRNHTPDTLDKMQGFTTVKNVLGETKRMHKDDPRILSGEWGNVCSSLYKINDELVVNIKHKYGIKFSKKVKAQLRNKPKLCTVQVQHNDIIYEVTRLS